MNEIWKKIADFENYEVSNLGNVRNAKTGRIMKPHKNTVGYWQTAIHKDGKQHFKCTHKLVAEAFVDNPRHCTEVNHLDEDKNNNRADNLAWCTHKENINHGTCIKRGIEKRKERYPAKKVIAIFPNGATHCYKSASDASKQLGLNEGSIRCVLGGSKRTLNGIRWIYLDQ